MINGSFIPSRWYNTKYNGNGSFSSTNIYISASYKVNCEVKNVRFDGPLTVIEHIWNNSTQSWREVEVTTQIYCTCYIETFGYTRRASVDVSNGSEKAVDYYYDASRLIFTCNFVNSSGGFHMHPSDFTPPEGYTTTYATIKNFPMVYYNGYQWELIDGEPTIEDMPNESEYTIPMPKAQWRIQSSYNDGFPWNELIPDIPYMNTFSHISQGVAEEITDTTTLPYKRVTISGYTNPDLIRFQDKDFEEGDLQKIGIFGLNSYRYIEKQNYTEGSTEVEIP